MPKQEAASTKAAFNPIEVLGKPSEIAAGFFISQTPVENKTEFLKPAWAQAGFEPKMPVYLKQVHSGTVIRFLNGEKPPQAPTGDAIITDSKGVFIVIQVADCLPVLLFDPIKRLIGGAHAGWKGSLLGIVPAVVRQMGQLGSRAKNLRVWLGPSIHSCCYEVDVERAVLFPHRPDVKRNIDLVTFNRQLLREAGVRAENIFEDEHCTACLAEKFPSYRRDGKKAGRIFACLALK